MQFTLSWLKSHLISHPNTDIPCAEICDILANIGLEVASVVDQYAIYKDFVVAKITEARKHPDADKLRICKVDSGKGGILDIVCGAPNARESIMVVLAPVGTKMPGDDNFVIKESKIRGITSQGMLCSSNELSVGDDADGIIEINNTSVAPGDSFAQYAGLDDSIIDVEITPNRGDGASVYGIARDIGASIDDLELKKIPDIAKTDALRGEFPIPIECNIAANAGCHSVILRYFKSIGRGNLHANAIRTFPKTFFSQKNGMIVDISNFLMLSYGRPNHAYDADKINGNISIKKSLGGERFMAIGGQEYVLPKDILIIADDQKVLSIAGVIGGEDSKITEKTSNVLLEIADFDYKEVVHSGRALNIFTDSRFRFERGIDYSSSYFFLDEFTKYMLAIYPETKYSEASWINHLPRIKKNNITLDLKTLQSISGLTIPNETVINILSQLGFDASVIAGDKIEVVVPAHREFDISNDMDIIGEILRIHGYGNITPKTFASTTPCNPFAKNIAQSMADALLSRDMTHAITWSFADSKKVQEFGFDQGAQIKISNPISENMDIMRQSIVPNLMNAVSKNALRGFKSISFFEIGSVYHSDSNTHQEECIAGIRAGYQYIKNFHFADKKFDFFDIKADVFALIKNGTGFDPEKFGIQKIRTPDYYHPNAGCTLTLGKQIIGYFGQIHPKIKLQDVKVNLPVFAFEIFYDRIPLVKSKPTSFVPIDFQDTQRDFAFVVQKHTQASEILKTIKNIDKKYIESVSIFDTYEVDDSSISMAFCVTMQSSASTLSQVQIDEVANKIIDVVCNNFNATLR